MVKYLNLKLSTTADYDPKKMVYFAKQFLAQPAIGSVTVENIKIRATRVLSVINAV
jgi:hypothetical protein